MPCVNKRLDKLNGGHKNPIHMGAEDSVLLIEPPKISRSKSFAIIKRIRLTRGHNGGASLLYGFRFTQKQCLIEIVQGAVLFVL